MSEHSSKPHKFVPSDLVDWCAHGTKATKYGRDETEACCGSEDDPIHAQVEPKPVEIAERERIRQEVWRRSDPRSPDSASHLDQLFEAKLELSQTHQRIASLEAELNAIREGCPHCAKPLEIAEKRWREWWNLCKGASTDNMNIRKNSLKALIEELSQAQQNVKSLRDTLELLAHEVFGNDLGSEPDVYADYDKLCELETIIRSTIYEAEK